MDENQLNSREQFLLNYFNSLNNEINTHLTVIWQAVTVVAGAFAFLALSEKNILPLDISITLIISLCAWMLSHIMDSAYWYNRNLVIIANIEKLFLLNSDVNDIQYYFAKHRPNNKMITHFRIQFMLGVTIALLVLLYHFIVRIWPHMFESYSNWEFSRALPYIITTLFSIYTYRMYKYYIIKYSEFVKNSPGKSILPEEVEYGLGHGFKSSPQK